MPGDSTTQALAAVDLAGDSVWYAPASTPGPFNISRSGTVFLMSNYSINYLGGTTCEYGGVLLGMQVFVWCLILRVSLLSFVQGRCSLVRRPWAAVSRPSLRCTFWRQKSRKPLSS